MGRKTVASDNKSRVQNRVIQRREISRNKFINVIHPNSVISNKSKIGYGCLISNNCNIFANSKLNNFCNLSPNVSLAPFSMVSDNCFLGNGVLIASKSKVGKNTYIGFGSSVLENIKVEEGSRIMPTTVVSKNITSKKVLVYALYELLSPKRAIHHYGFSQE